jgi:hypothetical protein
MIRRTDMKTSPNQALEPTETSSCRGSILKGASRVASCLRGSVQRSVIGNTMHYATLFILTTLTLAGAELRHFNPAIFGESADAPMALLLPGSSEALHPFSILTEIKGGQYITATVSYPKKVSFEEVRKGLNSRHKEYEVEKTATNPFIGIWRNEAQGYSIALFENDDAITVSYISFIGVGGLLNYLQDAYPERNPFDFIGKGLESDLKSTDAEPVDAPNDGPATSVEDSAHSGGGRHR